MRLKKPAVLVAVEIAVGSMALMCLSGGALAADSSQGTQTQPAVQPQPSPSVQAPETQPTVKADGSLPTSISSNGGGTPSGDKSQPGSPSPVTPNGGPGATVVPNGSGTTPASKQPSLNMPFAGGVNPLQKTDIDKPAVKLPETVTMVTAVPAHPVAGSDATNKDGAMPAPAMTYRVQVLPIQPTIISHVTVPEADLAATLPSSPKPDKSPSPAKSSGALVKLSMVMAGVVVPQPFLVLFDLVPRLPEPVLLGAFVTLLFVVFVFSYGLWLRRGGFATAARSDSPASAASGSTFATPLFLGYVSAPPRHRRHNPIFVLSGGVAFQKFLQKFPTNGLTFATL